MLGALLCNLTPDAPTIILVGGAGRPKLRAPYRKRARLAFVDEAVERAFEAPPGVEVGPFISIPAPRSSFDFSPLAAELESFSRDLLHARFRAIESQAEWTARRLAADIDDEEAILWLMS